MMFKGHKNDNIKFDSNTFYSPVYFLLLQIKINEAYTQAALSTQFEPM